MTSRLPILDNSTLHKTIIPPKCLLIWLQNFQYSNKYWHFSAPGHEDFSHCHFELQIFILAQKMTENVQLILQLLHPYTFISTSTVIREIACFDLNHTDDNKHYKIMRLQAAACSLKRPRNFCIIFFEIPTIVLFPANVLLFPNI